MMNKLRNNLAKIGALILALLVGLVPVYSFAQTVDTVDSTSTTNTALSSSGSTMRLPFLSVNSAQNASGSASGLTTSQQSTQKARALAQRTYSCEMYDMYGNCVDVPSTNTISTPTNNSTTTDTSSRQLEDNNQTTTTSTDSSEAVDSNNSGIGMMQVATHALHIRSTAGIAKNIIGYLKEGDTVNMMSRSSNNRWCQVEVSGRTLKNGGTVGWVACRYLKQQ